MKSPKIPVGTLTSIELDFIVKLPKFKEPIIKVVYNLILVITDKLSKYGYFISYKKVLLAKDLAYTFYKYIIGNHGLPKEIIFD